MANGTNALEQLLPTPEKTTCNKPKRPFSGRMHVARALTRLFSAATSLIPTTMKFNVTYEIVTPESAENGDAEERGFIAENIPLREAVRHLGEIAHECDSGPVSVSCPPRWVANYEYDEDFCTGARESRSLHFPRNLSRHSAMRIARLLGAVKARR